MAEEEDEDEEQTSRLDVIIETAVELLDLI